MFTPEHGRFRLLAKGARRRNRGQRALLQPFQALRISWSGKSSLKTLTGVEIQSATPRLRTKSLASAYYISELIFKFLHAHDAHEKLFLAYDDAIKSLVNWQPAEGVLRRFECSLLNEIGYGLQLERDVGNQRPIQPGARYCYYPEKGPIRTSSSDPGAGINVSGETLLALASGKFNSSHSLQESKQLLRFLLTRQIPDGKFRSREVYAQMLSASQKLSNQNNSKQDKTIA